jgi:hypothetical protein
MAPEAVKMQCKRCIEIGGELLDGGMHTPATSCFNLKFEAEQKYGVPEEKFRDGRKNGRNATGGMVGVTKKTHETLPLLSGC